jgi:hypothetical protein
MIMHIPTLLTGVADVSTAGSVMAQAIKPLMLTLDGIAVLICTFFLIQGGIGYMTSSGNPENLAHAKRVLRNAMIGLVFVLGAGALTALFTHAYASPETVKIGSLPVLSNLDTGSGTGGIADILVKAIVGLFRLIIDSAAKPFLAALDSFTKATPLMGDNQSIFKFWAVMVGLADSLFVVVVGLLGFHIMSAESLGLDEIDFKKMLPQLALTFLLINTSIFAIDAVITVSNDMITALTSAFGGKTVFTTLSELSTQSNGFGLVALIILVAFLILSVLLVVYYVIRLVILYLGTILSPIVILLFLLPGFKAFAATAVKQYVTTIFILFVHVVILLLAATIFDGMQLQNAPGGSGTSSLMATVVGIATLVVLLKTQGLMQQWSYAVAGPNSMRKMGKQFNNGVRATMQKANPKAAAQEIPKVVILKTSTVKIREAK